MQKMEGLSFARPVEPSLSDLFEPECLGDGGSDQVRIAHGSQWDEAGAVGKGIEQVSRYLQTQARFADTAWTREGHETHLWSLQEGTHCLYFWFASNQRGELPGQVVEANLCLVGYEFSYMCTSSWERTDK